MSAPIETRLERIELALFNSPDGYYDQRVCDPDPTPVETRLARLERDSHPPTAHPTLRLLDIVEDLLDCLDSEQGCFASTNVRDRLTTLRHELEKD